MKERRGEGVKELKRGEGKEGKSEVEEGGEEGGIGETDKIGCGRL